MHLKLFRHLWGVDLPWEQSFPKIHQLHYSGIETLLPRADDRPRFRDLLLENQLEFIATVHTTGGNVKEHLQDLDQQARLAREMNALFVAAQTGADAFDAAQCKAFYTGAIKIESETGILIAHETHRGRPLFNPWATQNILNQFPSLKLLTDLSHWVCVCERLLEDCEPILQLTARHTHHIHARVGYPQGPQVSDPRSVDYQSAVLAHDRWWKMIWHMQQDLGFTQTTMCPEYGPPPYLHCAPHTRQPVTDLWEIVEWQSDRLRKNFADFSRT